MDRLDTIKEQFLRGISKHEMTIECDEGINRVLKFSRPESNNQWFGLTTWQGYLCIYGDMGTYVFQRIYDMFNFFRMKKNDFNYTGELSINPDYWLEKLVADSKYEGAVQTSRSQLEKQVKEWFEERCYENDLSGEMKDEFWEAIECDLLSDIDKDTPQQIVYNTLYQFSHTDDKGCYSISDPGEWMPCTEPSHHFIWCLYAIVWGISQYDKSKLKSEVRGPSTGILR